ncbi:GCYB2-like protein [Mya arenaria]|uniref:GCYB2-like protein n=1 Tax=Mya arenaria TaxID=6604 RepID=A0ABY7G2E9_MYAAR|nr:GCYB2-like protein [Mya arenaria]
MGIAKTHTSLPKEPLLEMIGEYYLTYLEKRGFDEMLRNLGHNVLEFLQNLDSVHVLIRRDYPDMVAPSFRCDEDSSSDRMVLHYYSKREGLHSILEMSVVSIETIKVSEENGFREHVTFDVTAKKIKEQIIEEGPPTFIAQTKKHSEKQILKEKLEQIRLQLGENALPLNRKTSVQARWKIAAKITAMHRGFVPNYPETLAINPRMFIEMFPYHMLMPSIRSRQAVLSDFFQVRWPSCVDLNYENIGRFVLCPFILEFRRDAMEREWNDRPALQLKDIEDLIYYDSSSLIS